MKRSTRSAALLVLVAACSGDGAIDSSGTTGVTSTGTSETGPPQTGPQETATTDGGGSTNDEGPNDSGYEDDGGDGCTFTCPDGPPVPPNPSGPGGGGPGGFYECGLVGQSCPEGEKCLPYDSWGSKMWTATRCALVVADPGQLDEVCQVEGSRFSGLDTCNIGLMCFDVDPRTNEGVCRQVCGAAPECPSGTLCAGYGSAAVCRTPCDPFAGTCPKHRPCSPAGEVTDEPALFFTCEALALPTALEFGEECYRFHSECGVRRACVDVQRATTLCHLPSENCCIDTCALDQPDTCSGATICAPYSDPLPNAMLANVGVCVL